MNIKETVPLIVNLHSNMVRFIIKGKIGTKENLYNIYIPIWLDLLFVRGGYGGV